MNLFETDYLKQTTSLMKEAFKFKKYKAMHPFFAVTTGIVMIPIVAASFFAFAYLSIICFFFKTLNSPVNYLHSIVKKEGQETKHATQFIIYFASWPFILFLYAMISILLLQITVVYAILSILTYVWSLGGFRYHVFISESDNIEIEVNGRYRISVLVFFIVSVSILFIIPLFHAIILLITLFMEDYIELFSLDFYTTYIGISTVFAFIYSLVGLAPRPKEELVAEEAPVEEAQAPVYYN